MKHIKLFEGFSSLNPVITATGDWSKITLDGEPLDDIHPNTYRVTYYTNPSPDMLKKAKENLFGEDITIDPEQAADDILGGDQGGSNISKEDGGVIFLANPSYSPEDYKNKLLEFVDFFNSDPGLYEDDPCLTLLENPEDLTPEFLSHCKAVVVKSKMAQLFLNKYPQNYSEYPEILPGGDRSKIKIMNPRIELIFKVV